MSYFSNGLRCGGAPCGNDLAFERDASAIAIVSCLGGMYDLLEVEEVRPSRGSSQSCRP